MLISKTFNIKPTFYRAMNDETVIDEMLCGIKTKEGSGKPLFTQSMGKGQPFMFLDFALQDVPDLLGVVGQCLKSSVDASLIPPTVLDLPRSPASIRSTVLECVSALGQLQTILVHDLVRRQELELEVFDAKTALAKAHAELVGTQAGERHALHRALHDPLTGLPNRDCFGERLTQALSLTAPQKSKSAVLYLDLDSFKPVNDVHGHAAGDELLKIVAMRLRGAVREEDMVGRLGGDEFACLLTDLPSHEQLCHLVCKLFDAVSAPMQIGNVNLTVRPSIGVAICPTDGGTADALIANADNAMYCAKRRQTGYAFFGEEAMACG